jgi:methyl-accepting chemotaxis protein
MQWFRDLRTATKLILCFGVLALLMAVVGFLGIHGMAGIQAELIDMHDHHTLGLLHLKQANVHLLMTARELRSMLLAGDTPGAETHRLALLAARGQFYEEFEEYQKLNLTAETKALATEALPAFRELDAVQDEVIELAMKNQHQQAVTRLAGLSTNLAKVDHYTSELTKRKLEFMQKSLDAAQASYAETRSITLGMVVGAMALAVGLGLFIARLISDPLRAAGYALAAVSGGDFTVKLEVNSKDEIGQMAKSLNQAVDNMRQALLEVSEASGNVSSASEQLATASESVASGAQEQASSLEETASSLEEISSTIKQNAENARQASQLAAGSREAAEKGGQVVNAAVAAMGQINEASKHISDIITTIDEIAFQTNLLALNAAVEAARAGEQGRGFAVVASEVRNLAQRSAAAAKEIKGLIQDSVRKVENGSELVNHSGQTLGEIMQSVKRVTDIVAEIAAASAEQASGIEQVNKAAMQMDQVTQANSAQTEEMSSTAQGLRANAEQLQAMVGRFHLGAAANNALRAVGPLKQSARPAGAKKPRETREPALVTLAHQVGVSNKDDFEEF